MQGFILRFTNITLLFLLIVLILTGLYGMVWTTNGWVIDVHRFSGWALIALLPWKAAISWRSLKRGFGPGFDRGVMLGVSLFLAALMLTALSLAILWAWRFGPDIVEIPGFRQTVLAWHWILGLVLAAPLSLHVWRRWPKLKPVDFAARRGFLRLVGFSAAGLAGWGIASLLSHDRELPDQIRRISGSRMDGLFSGNAFPITSEPAPNLASDTWQIAVRGVVQSPFSLNYTDLLTVTRREQVATLDCTNGWWTTQLWQGGPTFGAVGPGRFATKCAGSSPELRNWLQPGFHNRRSAADPHCDPRWRRNPGAVARLSSSRRCPIPARLVLGKVARRYHGLGQPNRNLIAAILHPVANFSTVICSRTPKPVGFNKKNSGCHLTSCCDSAMLFVG